MTEKLFETLKDGDKVRVKKNIILDNIYNGILFPDHMKIYKGKILTISYIANLGTNIRFGRIYENEFAYTRDMLEQPVKFGK